MTIHIVKHIKWGLLAVLLCVPHVSYAYIDPNTGGYVFQFLFPIISAIAAAFLFFKKQVLDFICKIKGIFKKRTAPPGE